MQYRKYNDYHKTVDGIEYKQCKSEDCLEWYPMTLEFFGSDKGNKDQFNMLCKICQKKKQEKYYAETREYQIENAKEWTKNNYGKFKESYKKYTLGDKHKAYRKKNHEDMKNKGWFRKWQSNNKDKTSRYWQKRKVKSHKISQSEWDNCRKFFNYRCAYCGMTYEKHMEEFKTDLHKEHGINDGRNDIKNCIPSCSTCNDKKKFQTLNEFYNINNPNYTYDRYHQIYLWFRYEAKKYAEKKKYNKRKNIIKEIQRRYKSYFIYS